MIRMRLRNTIKPSGSAKAADAWVDHYEAKFFKPWFNQKVRCWSNWLDTDDGLDPQNLLLRMAAEMIAQMHFQFGSQLAQVFAQQAGPVQTAVEK